MKSIYLKPLLLLILCVFLTSCAKEDNGVYFNEVKKTYSSIELEILNLVNNHRESIGIRPLDKLDIVSSVALTHTKYMIEIDQVNHDNFAQRQESLVANAKAKSVGENVGYGYNSAQGIVNAWLKSDSHRTLIENPNYTHFGISTKENDNGRNYFTQMFIKR